MRLRSPALVLLLAALFAFYLWTAATGWRAVAFSRDLGRSGTPDFAGAHNLCFSSRWSYLWWEPSCGTGPGAGKQGRSASGC